MNGLDLETFLLLLRADLSAWVVLGLGTIGLALLVWSCWGSRRVLRRCLVLSLAAHLGLVVYGSTVPAIRMAVRGELRERAKPHIRKIRVAPLVKPGRPVGADGAAPPDISRPAPASSRLELAATSIDLADPELRVPRPPVVARPDPASRLRPPDGPPIPLAMAIPEPTAPIPQAPAPGPRADDNPPPADAPPIVPSPAADPDEVDRSAVAGGSSTGGRTDRPRDRDGSGAIEDAVGAADLALRNDVRLRPGPSRRALERGGPSASSSSTPGTGRVAADPAAGATGPPAAGGAPTTPGTPSPAPRPGARGGPLDLDHVTPKLGATPGAGRGLAALEDRPGGRKPQEVPPVYRPRVEPDRPSRARRAGASAASEMAVERALDWLARHQDRDGRWNAAVARYPNGKPVPGDRSFTAHCPAGETCFGECAYWEADTALTGLALLTYLGAGYTHSQGKHAGTVGKGLDFLIGQQKPDGDLRGPSEVVGMYCHAMATLALCEGYALTGDSRLRDPAERAIAFLVASRARDGLAWRYRPGEPVGDTSILGWVVMGLKSAREVGLPIPDEPSVRRGVLAWLDKVASGQAGGLASYQPRVPVTPTMTAEAWVCRQFLGVGGPGDASTEAARSLLDNESDRGKTNFYYWYYATLAFYQHGGEAWATWNGRLRDRIVGLQRGSGHQAGSWDPDRSLYGGKGGRIYCTTLAALTLEVYYRYLRLYDEPKLPSQVDGEAPGLNPPRREPPDTAVNREDQ